MQSVDVYLPLSPTTIAAPPVHWSPEPEPVPHTPPPEPVPHTPPPEDGPPPVTSTAAIVHRGMRFRGHAVPVLCEADIARFVADTSVLHGASPSAFRLAAGWEGCDDGGDLGTGQKLLDLLKRWDIENVAVAVTRDDSKAIIGGDALGPKRFTICLDCAKTVLEACYDDARAPTVFRWEETGTPGVADVVHQSALPPSRAKPRRQTPSIFTSPRAAKFVTEASTFYATGSSSPPKPSTSTPTRAFPLAPPPVLDMTRRSEIRALREPHADVELVFRCACAVLDSPRWLKPKGAPKTGGAATGWAVKWVDARMALGEHDVQGRLEAVDDVPPEAQRAVRDGLVRAGLGPRATDRLRARNVVASEFLPWLWARVAADPWSTYQSLVASPGRPGANLLVGRSLAVPARARDRTRVGGKTQLSMDTVDRTSEFFC